MSEDRKIDWEGVEIDYRAGLLSLRAIAEKYDIAHGSITKRAKRDGWERDLTARIASRAQAMVSKERYTPPASAEKLDTEKKVIEASATAIADVVRSHVTGIGKLQTVCDDLTAELVAQAIPREEVLRFAEMSVLAQTQEGEAPDQKDVAKRLNTFLKLLGLGDRADTFKKLVESKTRLITLERTAFDLDKGAGKSQSVGEFLDGL